MNNKKSKYYAFNECKTEFLFESDAEKVVLKEAEEKLYNLTPEEENDKFLKELKSFRHDL